MVQKRHFDRTRCPIIKDKKNFDVELRGEGLGLNLDLLEES